MKNIQSAIVVTMILNGCAVSTPKITTLSDGQSGFSTTCNGSAYHPKINWGTCYEAAATQCSAGFQEVDREQRTVDEDMAMRTLYFKCKKISASLER